MGTPPVTSLTEGGVMRWSLWDAEKAHLRCLHPDADAVVKIPGGPTETTEADWSQDDVV